MEINKYIDHTNLKATVTKKDIEKLCDEAKKYHFETVCINTFYVSYAKKLLENSNVGITTVVGFPLGMNTKEVKEYEAIDAINNGADEIDMVVNIGSIKNKDFDYVKEEIECVRDAIDGHVLKIIIETAYLTEDEIIKMTEICNETFVNFIKTSTGFAKRGASLEDIDIINEHKNDLLEIKASGGIKTEEEAIEFIEKGVTRIGTSHAMDIIKKCNCNHECDCCKEEK